VDKKSVEYNEKIKSDILRVIDENGNLVGDLSKADALKLAEEKELDIVVYSASATPPVAKLCLLDKYLFNLSKKEKQIKKNTKQMELKKLKIGVNIDVNDCNTKLKQAKKFIDEGNMVSFFMRFKKKEMPKTEAGIKLLYDMASKLGNVEVTKDVSMEKNVATLTIKPGSKKK